MQLRKCLDHVLTSYAEASAKKFSQHPLLESLYYSILKRHRFS